MSKHRILWVDDEPNLLAGLRRLFRKDYDFSSAPDGIRGLEILEKEGPFSVVISDLKMPGIDGIRFLSTACEIAPETVRVMMTGFADQKVAIDSINEGNIFRFLNKPCDPDDIRQAIDAAIRQYELVIAERQLLEQTVRGCVSALVEILGISSPLAFGRANRVREYCLQIASQLKCRDVWMLEIAALLSQIGGVTIPSSTIEKYYAGHGLTAMEESMFESQYEVSKKIISQIPRMERIVKILDTTFLPLGEQYTSDKTVLAFARILRVAIDYDLYLCRGIGVSEAIHFLKIKPGIYETHIVDYLQSVHINKAQLNRLPVYIDELKNGMVLDEDIKTNDGMMLVPKGLRVNDTIKSRLKNYQMQGNIDGKVMVIQPSAAE